MASPYTVNILDLPVEILEGILENCSYDEVSGHRLVCKQFNEVSKQILNQGFSYVDRLHCTVQKDVKSKLPRRESERRNHPLAKHVNVLSSVETRLSLLSMTFVKYIDMNLCCFIPGKVLDELLRVLRAVSKPDVQPRAHELLQELRDISSMAMEHFEEKIVPLLKAKMPSGHTSPFGPVPGCSSAPDFPPSPSMCVRPSPLRQEMKQIRSSLLSNSTALVGLRRDMSAWRSRSDADRVSGLEQSRRLAELGRGLAEAQKKVQVQEGQLTEMSRRIDGQDAQIRILFTEIADLKNGKASNDLDNNQGEQLHNSEERSSPSNLGEGPSQYNQREGPSNYNQGEGASRYNQGEGSSRKRRLALYGTNSSKRSKPSE